MEAVTCKKRPEYRHNLCFLGGLVGLFLLMATLPVHAEYEAAQTLQVKSFIDSKVVKGSNYTLAEHVKNDGMFNHYTVDSTFGQFHPASDRELAVLLNEIKAIAEMKQVETDDTVVASLKQSGKNTVSGIKHLFDDPQDTFEGAAAGIGSLFHRAKETVGQRQVVDSEDNQVKQLIGFSRSKGEIANTFNVNVYSQNSVLQDELERLAWADYAGGLGVGAVTRSVSGLGGMLLTTSEAARLLNEAINTTPASELWLQNKNKLLAMGIKEYTVTLFLNNQVFTPALTTIMTTALESMEQVENRDLLIQVALQASTPVMAKVVTEITALIAGYNKNIHRLKKLVPLSRVAMAEKTDGSTVILLPADYLIWTKRLESFLAPLSGGGEIWVSGKVSEIAARELHKSGWKVHTDVDKQLYQ